MPDGTELTPTEHAAMSGVYREILNRYMLRQSTATIAAALSMRYDSVHRVIHSPLFQSEVARLEGSVEEKIRETQEEIAHMAIKAKDQMYDLLESPNEGIRLKTCRDILDRAGLGAIQRQRKEIVDAAKLIELAYQERKAKEEQARRGNAADSTSDR